MQYIHEQNKNRNAAVKRNETRRPWAYGVCKQRRDEAFKPRRPPKRYRRSRTMQRTHAQQTTKRRTNGRTTHNCRHARGYTTQKLRRRHDTTRDRRHEAGSAVFSQQDDSAMRGSRASPRRDEADTTTAGSVDNFKKRVAAPRAIFAEARGSHDHDAGRLPRTHGRADGPSATQSGRPTAAAAPGRLTFPPAHSPPHFTATKELEKEGREREAAKLSARAEPGFLPSQTPSTSEKTATLLCPLAASRHHLPLP